LSSSEPYQNRRTKGNCERSFIDEYIFGKTECPEKQYPYKPSASGRWVRFSALPEGWNPTPSPIPTQNRHTTTVIVATTPPAAKFQMKDGHEGVGGNMQVLTTVDSNLTLLL
jgi:hypothetical protein